MKEHEIYHGFSKEQQAEYEKQLIERFGDKVKATFAECERNTKNWTKSDWDKTKKEFEEICKDLAKLIENRLKPNSESVQIIIRRHYQWLKKFWTPTKESYPAHSQLIIESDLRKAYDAYHPKLPEFLAEAIGAFAKKEL